MKSNTVLRANNERSDLTPEELEKLKKMEKFVRDGNDYFSNKNYDSALKSYLQAAEIDAENNTVKFNLGLTYLKLDNFAKANYLFESVYKNNPEDIETLKYVAFTYMKLEKLQISLLYWKRLLRLNPNDEYTIEMVKKLQNLEEVKQ